MEPVSDQVLALWVRLFPVKGYTGGATTELTKLFLQTAEQVDDAHRRIAELEGRLGEIPDPDLQYTARRILIFLRTTLKYPLPTQGVNACGDGAFYILLKADQRKPFVRDYFRAMEQMVAFETARWENGEFSIQMKKSCLNAADYLLACAGGIAGQNPEVAESFQRLTALVRQYKRLFLVDGLDTQDPTRLIALFEKYDRGAQRTPGYPEVLSLAYNLPQGAGEIKRLALRLMERDLPIVRQAAEDVARWLRLPPSTPIQQVWDALSKHYELRDVIGEARKVTKACNDFLREYLLEIGPNEPVRLEETPPYMAPLVTNGQDLAVDYLTDHPSSALYITPSMSMSKLTMINVLVHEFSHGFNFVHAARSAGSPLLNLDSPLQVPMTEGMALHREIEYHQAAMDLVGHTRRTPVQEAFMQIFGATPEEQAQTVQARDLEVYIWRVVRYLRALFDVEVNLGERSYVQFLNWAHEYTGFTREFIHSEVFSYLVQPGYAPCYAIPGYTYGTFQETGLRRGVAIKAFNTAACKMGFYPHTLGERKLAEVAWPAPATAIIGREV